MTEKNSKRARLIYGVILSCLIIFTGICFGWACLSIYQSGEQPFSRESVGIWFSKIQIPVYLCLAGILGGAILSLVLPLSEARGRAMLDPKVTLGRLLERLDETTLNSSFQKKLADERSTRKILGGISAAASSVLAVLALVYSCNPSHYTLENLNRDILQSVLVVFCCFFFAFVLCFACKMVCDASVLRELTLVKEALKEASPVKKEQRSASLQPISAPWKKWAIRGAILLVGILFILLGIFNGGAEDVLGKAIRICTECIGLG